MRLSRLASALGVVLVCLTPAPISAGTAPVPSEYDVKAAFVLNFGRLVEWPEVAFGDAADPMVFCVAGDREIQRIFESGLEDRTVAERPVEFRALSRSRDMAACHIAFITDAANGRSREFIAAAAGAPILMVGESADFAPGGGMISFYAEGTKIRFEINLDAVETAQLRISSRLLRLARIVSDGSE